MKPPINWFGGKQQLVKDLMKFLPPHQTYVEVFGGAGSLLFAKEPSPVEVYNDIDQGLYTLFTVLRDKEQFEEFRRLANLTPYSRNEYTHAKELYYTTTDPIKKAWAFYTVQWMSFSGRWGCSFRNSVEHSRRSMGLAVSGYLSAINSLPQIHERLMRVQIENQDWRTILSRYDRPGTLFYIDPPYVPETRRAGKYTHEITTDDHRELVEVILGLQGKAIISGYPSDVYQPLEDAGFQVWTKEVSCCSAGRTRCSGLQGEGSIKAAGQVRTEVVWYNTGCTLGV